MSLMYYLYAATRQKYLKKVRGAWLLRKYLQKNLLSLDKYYKCPYLGHNIFVCPNHSMGKTIFEGKVYEEGIIKIIQEFSRRGFSFVDVGANIGLHTLAAAFTQNNNSQSYYSFEPDPEIFSVLVKNCLSNNLNFVNCVNEGLGEVNEYRVLNVSTTTNKGRNSFFPREDTIPSRRIKISTLEDLSLNEDFYDKQEVFIKIDTEGYELKIIQGGVSWFTNVENLVVLCEISEDILTKNEIVVEELFSITKLCGLSNYIFLDEDGNLLTTNPFSKQYNVLFYKGNHSQMIINQYLLSSR